MTYKRVSQELRLLSLLEWTLERYRGGDEWVKLPEIMCLGIASHTKIISNLRESGYNIECDKQWVGGEYHTRYRLVREQLQGSIS